MKAKRKADISFMRQAGILTRRITAEEREQERKRVLWSQQGLFWSQVRKAASDECWLWIGSVVTRGYGGFQVADAAIMAHRYAYIVSFGQIPKSKRVVQKCRTRLCCNPAHLIALTAKEHAHFLMEKRTSVQNTFQSLTCAK